MELTDRGVLDPLTEHQQNVLTETPGCPVIGSAGLRA